MFVFSNLAISLDGKISTVARDLTALGSARDREHMMELRAECDAVLCGAETLRAFRKPLRVPGPTGAREQPINVIVSRKLEGIAPEWPFFLPKDVRRILIVSHEAKPSAMKRFEKRAEVLQLKRPTPKRPAAAQIMELLAERGIERLLIEGGGSVMWEFVKRDLIEEYHVTLVPKLIGGRDAPTLVDGEGFGAREILGLRLVQCRLVGEELYLVYRRQAGTQSRN